MFFAKPAKETSIPETETIVVGTSPQAFFLGDVLQNKNCAITFLVPENKMPLYAKNFSLTLRPSGFQNRRAEFSFASAVKKRPAFVFLASSPEDAKNDILLLTAANLKDVPIINLSFAYNRRLLANFADASAFPAFLDGQFLFEKNVLTFANRPQNLEICAPADTVNALKSLFGQTLNINRSNDPDDLFWQNFAPFFLGSLITIAQNQNMSSCLNNPQIRRSADSALKELSVLAQNEKSAFDDSKALTALYGFADNCKSEFTTPQKINALLNCFPQINRFDTPSLYELTAATLNKY